MKYIRYRQNQRHLWPIIKSFLWKTSTIFQLKKNFVITRTLSESKTFTKPRPYIRNALKKLPPRFISWEWSSCIKLITCISEDHCLNGHPPPPRPFDGDTRIKAFQMRSNFSSRLLPTHTTRLRIGVWLSDVHDSGNVWEISHFVSFFFFYQCIIWRC